MMAKALELRDEGTFIPLLAVDMNPAGSVAPVRAGENPEAQRYLLRRCGYPCDGHPNIVVTRLDGNGYATNDPYGWKGSQRTFPVAHAYIIQHWNELRDGDVVDVSFILGETKHPKLSERVSVPL